MFQPIRVVLAGVFLIAGLASAQSTTLFGVTGTEGTASSLFTVSITNGSTTLVGPTGFRGVSSLAFAPNGTSLYGVSNTGNSAGRVLLAINTATGVGTPVSASGTGTSNIADIAFRADGVLFAAGGSDGSGNLYTINTTTGIATLIGNMTGSSGGGNALAFNSTGTLYLMAGLNLYTVNTATGAATQVATPNWGLLNQVFPGMKFNPLTGVLFGSTFNNLASLSSFTGSPLVTNVGGTGVQLEAIAFSGTAVVAPPPPPPPTGVPAPSTLLLLGIGLAVTLGWFGRSGIRRTV